MTADSDELSRDLGALLRALRGPWLLRRLPKDVQAAYGQVAADIGLRAEDPTAEEWASMVRLVLGADKPQPQPAELREYLVHSRGLEQAMADARGEPGAVVRTTDTGEAWYWEGDAWKRQPAGRELVIILAEGDDKRTDWVLSSKRGLRLCSHVTCVDVAAWREVMPRDTAEH